MKIRNTELDAYLNEEPLIELWDTCIEPADLIFEMDYPKYVQLRKSLFPEFTIYIKENMNYIMEKNVVYGRDNAYATYADIVENLNWEGTQIIELVNEDGKIVETTTV